MRTDTASMVSVKNDLRDIFDMAGISLWLIAISNVFICRQRGQVPREFGNQQVLEPHE